MSAAEKVLAREANLAQVESDCKLFLSVVSMGHEYSRHPSKNGAAQDKAADSGCPPQSD